MTYDLMAHHQTLFDAIDGATAWPVYHTQSSNAQTNEPAPLPFVVYRQETERAVAGTPGDGSIKVIRSTWIISAYSKNLKDGLDQMTLIFNAVTDAKLSASDGYETTHIEPIGLMSLWERDNENYAVHGRIVWERST